MNLSLSVNLLDVISFETHERKNIFLPVSLILSSTSKVFRVSYNIEIFTKYFEYVREWSVNLRACKLKSLSIVSNRSTLFRFLVFAAVRYCDDLKLVKRATISTRQNSICYC